MRNKASKKAEAPKESKIVNRTLKQVFTNGTIVDGTYLTSDEANHCVAIKVSCRKLGRIGGALIQLTGVLLCRKPRSTFCVWHLCPGCIDRGVQPVCV